jgi:hypothetical protein
VTAAVALLVMLLTTAAGPGGAAWADDFVAGSGEASATVLRAGPITGRLDFTVGLGQSLVDYVGTVGRGQSKSVDFGLLGVLVTSHQCNGDPYVVNPQYVAPYTLRATSADRGAEKGPSKSAVGPFGKQQVWATRNPPSGRAVTTIAPFEVTGLVELAGGRADATTGVIKGRIRESVGRVELSSVTLLNGLVRLDGLRWDVVQRTRANGTVEKVAGSFNLAGVTISGVAMPVSGRSVDDVLDQVNKAIAYTGIALVSPRFTNARGEARISALDLRIFDSKLAYATVRPAVAAAYPVRRPVADAIIAIECRAAVPIAAADLVLEGLEGSGGTVLRFGGASASTEAAQYANPFVTTGGLGLGPVAGPLPPVDAIAEAAPATAGALPSISGGATGVAGSGVPSGAGATELVSRFSSVPGGRGGAALVSGLLGLLGVLLIAGADYVQMRRSSE